MVEGAVGGGRVGGMGEECAGVGGGWEGQEGGEEGMKGKRGGDGDVEWNMMCGMERLFDGDG